jgi:chromate transporter
MLIRWCFTGADCYTAQMVAPSEAAATDRMSAPPSFGEAFRFWVKLGFISFGGPAGQIAIMHRELVERRRWISEAHFLHALNYCMLLPGPEAQQLATYAGWLLHGTRGGIAAGVMFVLPSAVILWALSWAYMTLGEVPWVAALLYGLKPAVLAIVAAAVIRIGKKVLKNPVMISLAAAAFVALALFAVPFPWVVLGAGLAGWIGGRLAPGKFAVLQGHDSTTDEALGKLPLPSVWRAVKVLLLGGTVWWGPILAVGALTGWANTFFQQGLFFSKAAMVTFGGAYAVLPYVSQQAVEHYGWLIDTQMLDGLGLAETTPGPLIIVLQFVGFVGAWQQPGGFSPLGAATLGAVITTWATFAPCFLCIFLGAPYVERLRGNVLLNAALSAITAAVVGVILNLAVWFGWHILRPEVGRIDWFAAGLTASAFAALVRWKWDVVPVVMAGALAGLIRYLYAA